jgi:hypothetical protein
MREAGGGEEDAGSWGKLGVRVCEGGKGCISSCVQSILYIHLPLESTCNNTHAENVLYKGLLDIP